MTFRAVRRGWAALPAGIEDPYAFAYDLDAFQAFYTSAMPPLLEQAHHELVNLGDIQMPWPQGQRIGPVMGGYGAAPGNINVPSIEGRQIILEDLGEARVYSTHSGPSSDASWSRDARGNIDVDQVQPAFAFVATSVWCGTFAQAFTKVETQLLLRVTRVIHTAHSDVVLFQTESRFNNWAQIPEGCEALEPEVTYSTFAIQTFGREQMLPIGGQHTAGRWAVRLPAPMPGSMGGVGVGSNAGIIDRNLLKTSPCRPRRSCVHRRSPRSPERRVAPYVTLPGLSVTGTANPEKFQLMRDPALRPTSSAC